MVRSLEKTRPSPKTELSSFDFFKELHTGSGSLLTKESLHLIKEQTQSVKQAVDYGAGRNPLRALVFADNLGTIYAIDPAYGTYGLEDQDIEFQDPRAGEVFGGRYECGVMREKLELALTDLAIPDFSKQQKVYEVSGRRMDQARKVKLIPQFVEDWIETANLQTEMAVVWRVFPSNNLWAKIIAKLPRGGILITTGQGAVPDNTALFDGVEQGVEIISGVDIDNSSLPANGNTQAIGLEPLLDPQEILADEQQQDIYFYRKVQDLAPKVIEQALAENAGRA